MTERDVLIHLKNYRGAHNFEGLQCLEKNALNRKASYRRKSCAETVKLPHV